MNPSERMSLSLLGLSIGDAFGECFFGLSDDELIHRIRSREPPPGPWRYTDDTEMAVSVVEHLRRNGSVQQDVLARSFAERMDRARGYGEGAFKVLSAVREGKSWRDASRSGFGGLGSFGNGAAMRVAPLGAYFADSENSRIELQAALSAEITHSHPEGVAGAVAVAMATAFAYRRRDLTPLLGRDWLEEVIAHIPSGYTREGVEQALEFPQGSSIVDVAVALGNGSGVTAPDTIPLCLWVCAWNSDSFEKAIWTTVSALGDRDTTCAIVGGILGPLVGSGGVPKTWVKAREDLPIELAT